jgi:predicted Zn-dependent peptidase
VSRFATLACAAAFSLAGAAASAAERELPPAPGAPHELKLPAKETVRLDNGLQMTFIDYGSVPKATILAVVRTGNIDEGEDTWLPDLTVEMMKEGTETRSAFDIAKQAAGMGGALGLSVGAEQTTAGISVLSDHAVAAAGLLADVLRHPRFPESELPRVRANFERSVAVARADPGSLADEALARLVYGDHPFGRALPRDGQLAGYDITKIRGFYGRNFGARRTHVYVAGRYDRAALEAALREAFGDWQEGPPPTDLPAAANATARLELVDSPGAPQSSLRMAVPVPDPASALYFQVTLMNSLLGGTFGSRITSNIREDKGYSYSPDSSISTHRGSALWVMSAEITAEHTAAAIAEIFNEIDRLQREAPAAEELAPVKNYRAGVFVISNSSPNGVLGQLAFMDLHGLPDDFLTSWISNIRAVTPEQVSAMAREFIQPAHMTVVVAGDLAKVGDSVRALPQFKGIAAAPR